MCKLFVLFDFISTTKLHKNTSFVSMKAKQPSTISMHCIYTAILKKTLLTTKTKLITNYVDFYSFSIWKVIGK